MWCRKANEFACDCRPPPGKPVRIAVQVMDEQPIQRFAGGRGRFPHGRFPVATMVTNACRYTVFMNGVESTKLAA